jgi:hypothetical protein
VNGALLGGTGVVVRLLDEVVEVDDEAPNSLSLNTKQAPPKINNPANPKTIGDTPRNLVPQ